MPYPTDRIMVIVTELTKAGTITQTEAVAIRRCVQYSDQIADESLGAFFRQDIAELLKPI